MAATPYLAQEDEMTIDTIDNPQRTAARLAAFSGLFASATVVFANNRLLNSPTPRAIGPLE